MYIYVYQSLQKFPLILPITTIGIINRCIYNGQVGFMCVCVSFFLYNAWPDYIFRSPNMSWGIWTQDEFVKWGDECMALMNISPLTVSKGKKGEIVRWINWPSIRDKLDSCTGFHNVGCLSHTLITELRNDAVPLRCNHIWSRVGPCVQLLNWKNPKLIIDWWLWRRP